MLSCKSVATNNFSFLQRAALENEEMVFERKLSEANSSGSVEMEVDVEKGDMCVTVKKKKKRRNPIHKATKILGMKKPSVQS